MGNAASVPSEDLQKVRDYHLSVKDLEHMKQQFRGIDVNGSGSVDIHEFTKALGAFGMRDSLLSR